MDRFVKVRQENQDTFDYYDFGGFAISFEGKFFYETYGGYKRKKLTDDSNTTRLASLESSRLELNRSLNILTTWIAVGTLIGAVAALIAAWYYLCQLFPHWRIGGRI